MMHLSLFFCTTLILITTANYSFAQNSAVSTSETTKTKQEKKQTISFEDELVEGTAQKPEFFYLFQKKNFNYKRLIRLRENFIPEMRNASEDIQRLKGGR